jgi:hypothetical protein
MKDAIEILNCILVNETKSVETMRHSIKEDELTILRLQNKLRALEKDIGERIQLIKESRGHLVKMSELTHTEMKLMSARNLDVAPSITRIKPIRRLEKQA